MKKNVSVFGFEVYDDHLDKISFTSDMIIINTISPNSYGLSKKDKLFKDSLLNSDYLMLDGVYFSLAPILLKGKGIKKNQGPFLFESFLKRINKNKGKIFFLGSSLKTLKKIKIRLNKEYPNVKSEFFPPPYKKVFTDEENFLMISKINEFKPDVLFVGMTCPKQEKWVYENRERINAKYAISIGGVFDWYAGNEKEIAPIWWKLNLAWLIRTINRPEILRRYPNIGIFFWDLFLSVIRVKKN